MHSTRSRMPRRPRRRRGPAPLAEVAERIPPTVGVLEAVDARTTVLTTGGDDLDVLALHLGLLDLPFRVREPHALRERLVVLAERLRAGAG